MAAGKGSRISSITNGEPKCFLEIGGKKLIDHQIDTLKENGINNIVIVTGYKSESIKTYYQDKNYTFLINPFYQVTNVLASVWFAIDYLHEGFYFMHADTFFEPTIFSGLKEVDQDIILGINKKETIEEDMKVVVENNLVKIINKEMPCEKAYGEFIGLAKFSPSISSLVINQIKKLIENGKGNDFFFEEVIQNLIDVNIDVNCFDIGEKQAIEIDFPDDYTDAKIIYNDLYSNTK